MVSIRQNAYPDLLPDFRNVGVVARILLAVNAAALVGTTQLPKFEADMFSVAAGGTLPTGDAQPARYLISTSEITLANSVRDEILPGLRSISSFRNCPV